MSFVIGMIGGAVATLLFQMVFPNVEQALVDDLKDEIARLKAKLRSTQGKS